MEDRMTTDARTDGFTTCLWFEGRAEEAAHHYVSIFKNSSIGRVSRYGEGAPQPAGSVLTIEFTAFGQKFVGLNGGPEFKFTEAISFQIPCENQEEIDYYWTKLTDGGEPGPCGWLKDKFGVSWQVVPSRLIEMITDPDPAKVARATESFMAMGKFDLAALEKAFAGE
ncbi:MULTISPECIES: VOC family protein [unclassified Streptomyces]|uniref:VOC family protein n=1 Tax=unclassified Streptomyces TaxID=2593676 RepID=UPI0033297667